MKRTPAHGKIDSRVMRVARNVARRLADERAEAVVLVGSRVRGDAYDESDIDIWAMGKGQPYRLERIGEFLVTVSWRAARRWRQAFRNPSEAGGAVPVMRTAVVLYDPKGIAADLKREAKEWTWDAVVKKADRWVAEEFTGWAEEVHRLVGNLELGRTWAAAIQRSIFAIRIAPVLAVHHRILYDTENRLWDLVAAKMGQRWSKTQETALGADNASFEDTCKAALQLFTLAAAELDSVLNERQRAVVKHACTVARSVG